MKAAISFAVGLSLLGTVGLVLVARAEPGTGSAAGPHYRTLEMTPQRAQAHRNLQAKRLQVDLGTAPTVSTGAKVLTAADLHTMLDNMGLNPTTGTYSDGSKYETFSEQQGTWTFSITANLSPDTTNIWLYVGLGQVKNADSTKPANWYNLVALEGQIWPAYINYSAANGELSMNMPLRNADITPATLRKSLDTFMSSISSNSSTWDSSTWPTSAPPAAAASAAPSGN